MKKGKDKPVKVKTEVVEPEMTLQVELKAEHLVDLQVAVTEEQLILREEELIEELSGLRERQQELVTKRNTIFDKIGKRHEKAVCAIMNPALRKAGVKRLESSVEVQEDQSSKTKLHLNISVGSDASDKNSRGSINFYRSIPVPKELKALDAQKKAIHEKVNQVNRDLEKTKMDLMNIDRIERKARGVLAQQALESSPAGKRMLENLKRKAIPAPK